MLLSFLSTSKFEAAQNEAESEHDGELRRVSRLNNAKRLIKADLFQIGFFRSAIRKQGTLRSQSGHSDRPPKANLFAGPRDPVSSPRFTGRPDAMGISVEIPTGGTL
jgi:hypothetical protein